MSKKSHKNIRKIVSSGSLFNGAVSTTNAASTITVTAPTCASIIAGMPSVSHCAPCFAFAFYYHFIYNYTAISTVTRIAFAYLIQNYYFAIDDVSVRDFVAPNTELITNGGFETGDLTGWQYCNQLNAPPTGGVRSNYTYAGYTYYPQSGSYLYLAGSNISADYIIQSFPTQIGHQYTVSLWTIYPGSGSPTSADLFLGV